MISIDKLGVEFSATPLFLDATFVVNPKDRIALVGKNGAGKSTMLKIIAGMWASDTPKRHYHWLFAASDGSRRQPNCVRRG